jgi:hypothetical protein
MMEGAVSFSADAVFFEVGRNGSPAIHRALIFISDAPADAPALGDVHRRVWNWGSVPLIYRKVPGLVQLFSCAHNPDFASPTCLRRDCVL